LYRFGLPPRIVYLLPTAEFTRFPLFFVFMIRGVFPCWFFFLVHFRSSFSGTGRLNFFFLPLRKKFAVSLPPAPVRLSLLRRPPSPPPPSITGEGKPPLCHRGSNPIIPNYLSRLLYFPHFFSRTLSCMVTFPFFFVYENSCSPVQAVVSAWPSPFLEGEGLLLINTPSPFPVLGQPFAVGHEHPSFFFILLSFSPRYATPGQHSFASRVPPVSFLPCSWIGATQGRCPLYIHETRACAFFFPLFPPLIGHGGLWVIFPADL